MAADRGSSCEDCTFSRWVEFGEGGLYLACTRDGLKMLYEDMAPACPDFEGWRPT